MLPEKYFVKTDSQNQDFIELVKYLDADLVKTDGEEHAFYNQFNKIDLIKHVIVVYENEKPLACGALKEFDSASMEVKRMYVKPEHRGKGLASAILLELENWATALGYQKCILETGNRQPDAIALYKKNGYEIIPNYGQYANVENSVCFQKRLNVK
jgi:putative acetyltransferase